MKYNPEEKIVTFEADVKDLEILKDLKRIERKRKELESLQMEIQSLSELNGVKIKNFLEEHNYTVNAPLIMGFDAKENKVLLVDPENKEEMERSGFTADISETPWSDLLRMIRNLSSEDWENLER